MKMVKIREGHETKEQYTLTTNISQGFGKLLTAYIAYIAYIRYISIKTAGVTFSGSDLNVRRTRSRKRYV